MKKILRCVLALNLFVAVLLSATLRFDISANTQDIVSRKEKMKGVWVASVVNIDYPRKQTPNASILKQEADSLIKQAKDMGFNTIFLQVRPTSDALYKSRIFPWSKWLTGKENLAPSDGFDPLEYFVRRAHEESMELHAWLNPYRITKRKNGEKNYTVSMLSENHPARLNPHLVVQDQGNLYYDPALPEARKLIIDGIKEIIENYRVDGIHFDDYFYPSRGFKDDKSYAKYGNGMDKADWRRENVNTLLRDIHKTIKEINPRVSFGISPFGIWDNKKSNPRGSNTRGNSSYSAHYADSLAWIDGGYIDYILPQIYWHIGFSVADYKTLVNWWASQVRGKDVDLYIGIGAYKSSDKRYGEIWHDGSEIIRQFDLNKTIKEISGEVLFSMRSMQSNMKLYNLVKKAYYESSHYVPKYKANIQRPYYDIEVNQSYYYLGGISDPNYPLYINDILVKNRSDKGFFSLKVDLDFGKNTFVLKNGPQNSPLASEIKRVITRTKEKPMKSSALNYKKNLFEKAEFEKETLFPNRFELLRKNSLVKLSCIAPKGSVVTVNIRNKKIKLEELKNQAAEVSLEKSKFVKTIKPYDLLDVKFDNDDLSDSASFINYGKLEYSAVHNGKSFSSKSSHALVLAKDRARFFGKVIKDDVDLRLTANPSDGSAEILQKGMIEEIRETVGDKYKLVSGRYVSVDAMSVFFALDDYMDHLQFASHKVEDSREILNFKTREKLAYIPRLESGKLILEVPGIAKADKLEFAEGSILKDSTVSISKNRAIYEISLSEPEKYNGSYTKYEDGFAKLIINKRQSISSFYKPLEKIKLVIDPGHGGSDHGAIGLLGLEYSEKKYNLFFSKLLKEKLLEKGAKVVLTRKKDELISLYQRLRFAIKEKPDLFISVHANSVHLGNPKVEGFSVYYSKDHSKEFANLLQENVLRGLGPVDRGVMRDDFYVIRSDEFPSVLLEPAFMPSPNDMDWLIDFTKQEQYANEIVRTIMIYFGKGDSDEKNKFTNNSLHNFI